VPVTRCSRNAPREGAGATLSGIVLMPLGPCRVNTAEISPPSRGSRRGRLAAATRQTCRAHHFPEQIRARPGPVGVCGIERLPPRTRSGDVRRVDRLRHDAFQVERARCREEVHAIGPDVRHVPQDGTVLSNQTTVSGHCPGSRPRSAQAAKMGRRKSLIWLWRDGAEGQNRTRMVRACALWPVRVDATSMTVVSTVKPTD
jgi:hypothetical protein